MNERPVIVAIEEDADGDDVRVTITLDWQDRHHYGTAVGRADPPHRARLAAEAALQAVEHIGGDRIQTELMAVATADVGEAGWPWPRCAWGTTARCWWAAPWWPMPDRPWPRCGR